MNATKATYGKSNTANSISFLFPLHFFIFAGKSKKTSMFTTWCSHCNKLKKEEARRKQKEEAQRQKERDAQEQERIFEEARRKLLEEEQRGHSFLSSADYANLFQNWPSYCYVYSQSNSYLNDESINQLAAEKAKKDLADGKSRMIYEDLFFLHKILMTSKEMLITKLWAVPKEELASFYRRNAIRLHPDKTGHPNAMEAFQKFTECYKACCNKRQQQELVQ